MDLWIVFIILALVGLVIYVYFEVKRFKHKIFAIFLIALLLFFSLSVMYVFKGKEVDLKSFSGVKEVTVIYFSWLWSIFVNMKTLTSQATKMDWGINQTSSDIGK